MGRPETVASSGALIALVNGHSAFRCGLSTIAGPSSYTNTPAKLVEYAQAAISTKPTVIRRAEALRDLASLACRADQPPPGLRRLREFFGARFTCDSPAARVRGATAP